MEEAIEDVSFHRKPYAGGKTNYFTLDNCFFITTAKTHEAMHILKHQYWVRD